ncbi:hypothetical protein GRW89_10575 [Pseudomonas moraviensis]|uniref:hypothetical protein n=1 Tax=Pseudomonas moraviensis TaxID=321662 RepID=UPI00135E3E88|nr:hypothetical protein [Pseudomonas moraviensis]MXI46947.1 hypothetical protein [Pseudomonas moraviensis]
MNSISDEISAEAAIELNWNYTNSFPSSSDLQVERRDVLDTILEIFTPTTSVVFLEGDSGIGATTTLAQFVAEHCDIAFSLFLNPSSRLSYSLEYIKVKIAEQLKIFVDGVPFDKGAIDEAEYGTLVNKTRAKLKGKNCYFVVDGLNHIPNDDEKHIADIMGIALPIGVEGFRFLISGPQIRLGKHINKIGSKPYQLKRFTPSEVDALFKEFPLTDVELDEVKLLCKGNPGRLCAIRRTLKAGGDITEVMKTNPEKYLDFIALDFQNFDTLSVLQKKIIATLAFSKQLIGSLEIAAILNVSESQVHEAFELCSFLEMKTSEYVDFISNAHRKLSEVKLKEFQVEINDLQIEYLKKDPNSGATLLFLPNYLQQQNKNKELIELISNEHYYNLLDSTQSLTQLRNRAEIGLISAQELKSAMSAFQFSLQKSLFIDLSGSNALKSEVDALVAIGKTQHAMILVEGAVTKLAKLSLLAAYCSGLKKKSKNVDGFLLDQIKDLTRSVNFSEGGDTALQIAEDLLHVDANLATETLEKCMSHVNDTKHKDLAFSRLSIVASLGQNAFETSAVESHIKSKAIQEFTSAFTQYHKNQSIEEILKFLVATDLKSKIKLIIQFISFQRRREGLIKVIDYALDLIVKDASYLPKAKDYADLAAPLRHQEVDSEKLAAIISRFDGQTGLVKKTSVTRDWVRLSTSLSYAEAKYDKSAAYRRLLECYYEVCELQNHEIQSECYARLLYALKYIDPEDIYEKEEGLKFVIDEGLKVAVDELLCNAASQHDCIASVLPAIVEYDVSEALAIAKRLNTAQNRNLAFQQISELLLKKSSSEQNIKIFNCILSELTDHEVLCEVIASCTKILWQKDFDQGWAETLQRAERRIRDYSISTVCRANIFKAYSSSGSPLDAKYLVESVETLIAKDNATGARNDICFRAIEILAEIAPDEAERLYTLTTETRGTLEYECQEAQHSFLQCLALVVRAFSVALKNNMLDAFMLERLTSSISRLASVKQQMSLYTDLACRAWVADSMLQTIVSDHCRPLLDITSRSNPNLYKELLEISFPALYVAHADSALKEISHLDELSQNAALFNTCELIRRKLTKYDPPPTEDNEVFFIDHQQAGDVVTLLENMTYDTAIYQIIKKLTISLAHKKNKSKLTQLQRKEISNRILKLIDAKLPDPRNITHNGYKICASAYAYTLVEASGQIWQTLVDQAATIPNVADKAYVLIQIARSLPGKYLELKKTVLSDAEKASDAIPSLKDKLGRLELFSLAFKDLNLLSAKNALKRTLKMSHEIEDMEEATSIQKSLIDAADQIEPGFADVLLELFDDDPARTVAKASAKHNVEVLKAKKSLADFNSTEEKNVIPDEYLAEASWKNLSSLLNNRITPKQLSTMTSFISVDSNLGLGETYPYLCWYIENAARKYISKDDVKMQILPLCEVLLLTTELAFSVVGRKLANTQKIGNLDKSLVGLVVKPNSRSEAFGFIQKWLNLNCVDYIKFCDPYFTAEDVEIVQLIQAANPTCIIHILATASYLKDHNCNSNEAFDAAWLKLSDQTAPETYIYGVDKLDGKELIHDRWLISKGGGLRLGTSLNGMGNKFSEISIMTPQECVVWEAELDNFLNNPVIVGGARVRVTRYQL